MASFLLTIVAACCLSLAWGASIGSSANTTLNNSTSANITDGNTDTNISISMSYGVFLDAGSSSTKLKVYQWKRPDTYPGVPIVTPLEVPKNRFKPGLSAYEGDLAGMRTYLANILQKAQDIVPAEYHAATPLYLLATAGFRLLGTDNAREGMEEVDEIFLDSTVHPFLYVRGGASVLSGEEEGVYAWIAANYLLGFFDSNKPDSEAVGVLEMGGGSTQITFIPRDPLMAEEFQVTMAGRRYSLYVQSYLQFGMTSIAERVDEALIAQHDSPPTQHPCLLKGDQKTLQISEDLEVTVEGSGDAEACRSIFEGLVATSPSDECLLEPCAIGSVFQPSVDGIEFYATAAFTYSTKAIGAILENSILDLANLWDKAVAYCDQDLSEIPEGDRKFGSSNCRGAIYINALLTGPYGFPKNTTQIKVTKKINGEDIDWALGAMIDLLSLTFTGDPNHCSVTRR